MKVSVQLLLQRYLKKYSLVHDFVIKNKRFFLSGCICIICMLLASLFFTFFSSGSSRAMLSFKVPDVQMQSALPSESALYALNRPAKKSAVLSASSPYAYFAFTQEQKNALASFCRQRGGASLSLSVCVHKSSEKKISAFRSAGIPKPFSIGFLYEEDFASSKKLKKEIEGRPLVSADLVSFLSVQDSRFSAAFCLSKSSEPENYIIPAGFFIYSVLPVSLENAQIIPPQVGWDRTANLYAFAPNGGTIDSTFTSFDFSGASLVFPVQNTQSSLMPRFEISFDIPGVPSSSENKNVPVRIIFSGERITFYCQSAKKETLEIPAAGLDNPFAPVTLDDNAGAVSSILLTASNPALLKKKDGEVLCPYTCDPGLIISWKTKNWRGSSYELFEWPQFPGVLYFDTRSYAVQSDFFRRLAFFTEKNGYRGRLLTDVELGSMHGYNAHDYSASSLAAFFSAAASRGFALNQKEYLLRDILIENGIIRKNQSGLYDEGKGAVISISQESQEHLRRTFVAHEGWHGIFFTDADYRNAVAAVYYTMDQTALAFLQQFWVSQPGLQYDLNDEFLMHNELMAYLMQQPLKNAAPYFMSRAKWPSVQRNQKATADYILSTQAAGLEDAAVILDSYVHDRWGFNAGRVWLLSR